MRRASIALLAALAVACASGSGEQRAFLTPADYFAGGERALAGWLREDAPAGAADALAAGRAATVRVRALRPGGVVGQGSGVVLADGRRVLTAGHVVAFGDEVRVRLADGRDHALQVAERVREGEVDWALLEGSAELAPRGLVSGSAAPGDYVWVLGYPGGLGRDGTGRVVPDAEPGERALDAIALCGRLLPGGRIEPVAGAVPSANSHGISGGPVVDLRGELVGVVTGLVHTADADGAPRWEVAFTPVEALRSRL